MKQKAVSLFIVKKIKRYIHAVTPYACLGPELAPDPEIVNHWYTPTLIACGYNLTMLMLSVTISVCEEDPGSTERCGRRHPGCRPTPHGKDPRGLLGNGEKDIVMVLIIMGFSFQTSGSLSHWY